ncbi:predicted protein [Nematostella vectensis]|uniref:G-protein coupled receptors family 1 profile domain-containing protein n=1 Tax=Nematostella vectensis TaxID=45351 RepID=A7SKC4_NEMVE|nr:predicted protein [Nematostella vectensis]|eukprot:XP_001627897.1 predicted protein [Nematostella vectensis]
MNESATFEPSLALPSRVWRIAWYTAFIMEAILIVTANLLTILTLTANANLRKRSVYFVVNLAISDFLAGAILMPMFAETLRDGLAYNDFIPKHIRAVEVKTISGVLKVEFTGEKFYLGMMAVFFMYANVLSFVFISVERMYATVWPLRHRNTRHRTYMVFIGVTWCAGAVFALMSYVHLMITFRIIIVSGFVAFIVMTACYATIFIKVKRQNALHNQSELQRTVQKQRELAKTLLLVTVMSLVTWSPLIGVGVLSATSTINPSGFLTRMAVYWICGLNSLCNPVVYFFRVKEYRRAFKRLVCKYARNRSVQPIALNVVCDVSLPAITLGTRQEP